jgi:hypothetical protein
MLSKIFKTKDTAPTYQIDKSNFKIDTKGLIGVINSAKQFCWAIDLYALDGEIDENIVSPKFSFTELEPSEKFKFDKKFIWTKTSAYNEKTGTWKGDFYIFDAHYFECNIEFIKLNDNKFNVKITGEVNINPETYPTTHFVPFEIQQEVDFNGVLVEIENEQEAFDIASNFIETSAMKWKGKTNDQENNWLK